MIEPKDAAARRAVKPVICYPVETLPAPNMPVYEAARQKLIKVDEVLAPAREAAVFNVPVKQQTKIETLLRIHF